MKTSRTIVLVILIWAGLSLAAAWAQNEKKPAPYIVGGVRNGASFFPRVDYPETRPLVPGQMDFKHYHDADEVLSFLRQWEKEYPDLVALYSVGKSFEGRDIWQITITNKKTGRDTDKPAMFLEGNRHSGEVTGAEAALYFAWHILTRYGQDPAVTALVDTKALYVKIKNNPDGSELYLHTAQSNRSTVRPHDDDGDGLLDEDPPEDLDGDGYILQMRKKVEAGKGDAVLDPEDKTGRLMKRVGRGKGDYVLYSEGVDSDGDGRYNEDGVGGLDLHRNYPENWRPEPGHDLTGRGYAQNGAGEYPLSETETRAVVLFLLEHPNVSVVQTLDTAVPMLLRPPSTSRSEESMFPEDLKLYRHFDAEGKKITGYPYAGDVFYDYALAGQDARAQYGLHDHEEDETGGAFKGSPLFGHSPDFGYFSYGAIWYGDEIWSGGRVKDYNGDGRVSELEVLRWNDEELGGKGFFNWKKFNHPELGEVEIGGSNPKFFRQNPPVEKLEEWARGEALFNLFLAESLPQVKVVSAEARRIPGAAGSYEVKAVFTNTGYLPTALRMAERVKIVRPDWAVIKLSGQGVSLDAGSRAKVELGILASGQTKEVLWKVKAAGTEKPVIEVGISSTRGGIDKKSVRVD